MELYLKIVNVFNIYFSFHDTNIFPKEIDKEMEPGICNELYFNITPGRKAIILFIFFLSLPEKKMLQREEKCFHSIEEN